MDLNLFLQALHSEMKLRNQEKNQDNSQDNVQYEKTNQNVQVCADK